jgi:hypothetical protein
LNVINSKIERKVAFPSVFNHNKKNKKPNFRVNLGLYNGIIAFLVWQLLDEL